MKNHISNLTWDEKGCYMLNTPFRNMEHYLMQISLSPQFPLPELDMNGLKRNSLSRQVNNQNYKIHKCKFKAAFCFCTYKAKNNYTKRMHLHSYLKFPSKLKLTPNVRNTSMFEYTKYLLK